MKAKKAVKTAALTVRAQALDEALANAVALWIAATTDGASVRYRDLARSKRAAVAAFLAHAGKPPDEIKVTDVAAWEQAMAARNLAANTLAARLAYVSSFFSWLMRQPGLAKHLHANPFLQARRKTPRPYQSDATKALSNAELQALRTVVQQHAESREVQALRDHAIFLLLMYSGMRRAEVLRLRGQDLAWDETGLLVGARLKGGKRVRRYVTHPSVWRALLDYLDASERLTVIQHLRAPEVAERIAAQAERKQQAAAQKAVADKAAAEAKDSAAPSAKKKKGKQGSTTEATTLPRELANRAPLWVRHDPGRAAVAVEQPLAEWTFARRMKTYAAEAGIEKFHLHQTRHTFARIVAEATGSLSQTQEALGHQHLATTRAYVERISTLPDRHRDAIAQRLEAAPGKKERS
jgi:integrase